MATNIRDASEDLPAEIVLGIGAHADDLDFSSAGTIAKLAAAGAAVYYLILTDGSKGSADPDMTTERLVALRRQEQRDAAKSLGARDVFFLDYEDGALEVTLSLKRDIVRYIRQLKPDVVMAFDPTMVYAAALGMINHPDHRACGQAVLDAVYPLARDHMTFPELAAEGLETHKVRTVLLSNFEKYPYVVDISDTIGRKDAAIAAHASQVGDLDQTVARFRERAAALGHEHGYDYAEGFVRIDVPA